MNVVDRIREELARFQRVNYDTPTSVYLGTDEYFELVMDFFHHTKVVTDNDGTHRHVMGLEIFRVLNPSHLRIA